MLQSGAHDGYKPSALPVELWAQVSGRVGSELVRVIGFEPTVSCVRGRHSCRAELHPVLLALRREIESLSPDRQSGRLTRCVTEREWRKRIERYLTAIRYFAIRNFNKLVRLGRLERPLDALSTHSLCRLGYRRLAAAAVILCGTRRWMMYDRQAGRGPATTSNGAREARAAAWPSSRCWNRGALVKSRTTSHGVRSCARVWR